MRRQAGLAGASQELTAFAFTQLVVAIPLRVPRMDAGVGTTGHRVVVPSPTSSAKMVGPALTFIVELLSNQCLGEKETDSTGVAEEDRTCHTGAGTSAGWKVSCISLAISPLNN